jgi:hypothetical protein
VGWRPTDIPSVAQPRREVQEKMISKRSSGVDKSCTMAE